MLKDLGDKGKAGPSADKKIKIDGASTKRLRADFDDLKREMDPVERSAYELQNRLALLDRALKQGAVSQAEYNRVAGQARAQNEALAASFQKVETGAKLAADQITNLGYQIQDVAVQLAGGQNPFLILIQQGPQAAGAVSGLGVLMRLMLSPTALDLGELRDWFTYRPDISPHGLALLIQPKTDLVSAVDQNGEIGDETSYTGSL